MVKFIKKKHLLSRIQYLESEIHRLNGINKEQADVITEMAEKVEFLYRQNNFKTASQPSLFDEWINGAEEKEGDK